MILVIYGTELFIPSQLMPNHTLLKSDIYQEANVFFFVMQLAYTCQIGKEKWEKGFRLQMKCLAMWKKL